MTVSRQIENKGSFLVKLRMMLDLVLGMQCTMLYKQFWIKLELKFLIVFHTYEH